MLVSGSSFGAEKGKTAAFEEKHKDGQFIFLLQEIDIKVNEDWSYTTKTHKKVKILKGESRDMGEIPISYENGREKVTDVEAFTITPDNKKHPYSKIQDFKIYDGAPMYSDAMVKVVTLPEVTIGSILEYKYTIFSNGLSIKNAFWYASTIDSSAPMKEFKFSIMMPKILGIKYREFEVTRKPKITESKSSITYSWAVKDIDGLKEDEDYLPLPTPESFKENIEFSSINSWCDISDWCMTMINKNLKMNPDMEETVKKITGGHATIQDKTKAILAYIQDNFRYVSMGFEDHALEPHPTDRVFQNKYGDCKDLSLLTMAMLRAASIESRMVLFNTEFSLSDPQYDLPIPSLFNHILLLVKDPKNGDFYIDPLLNGYDIGQYPLSYQGAYTFVVTEDGGKFDKFPVFDEKKNYFYSKKDSTIAEDGSALTETESLWNLDFSVQVRDKMKALDQEEKAKVYETLDARDATNGQVLERRIEGLDQKYGPIKSYNKIKRKDEFPVTDGIMVIEIAGYDEGLNFTNKEREHPIFFPINSLNEVTTIYRIPKGYVISYVPPDLNLDIGFFSIKRGYIKGQNEVKVTEVTQFKRMQLPKEDYDKVKQFFNQLPVKTHQRIMVKKEQGEQETYKK